MKTTQISLISEQIDCLCDELDDGSLSYNDKSTILRTIHQLRLVKQQTLIENKIRLVTLNGILV